jgi:bifunctional non-homologous end joining protein LigD
MPGFIKPQLATLKSKAPQGQQWLHEIKFDGYRVQLHLNEGRRKAYTRNGLDWTKRFSQIAGALDIPGQVIVDGEVVVIHEGRTNFSELQADLAAGRQDRLVYYAFDLLWRDGDLRKFPQIERKQALRDLLDENGIEAPVVYSEHLIGDGQEMFEHAARELGRYRLEACRRSVPIGADRNRRRRAVPGKARRQRPGLYGQGRYGLVPHGLQPNPQAARYRGEP